MGRVGDRVIMQWKVHGVAGTPPAMMLELEPELVNPEPDPCGRPSKATDIQMFRRPQGGDGLRAYSWSSVTSGKATTALYVLLLPFMLANVAGWMTLPLQRELGTLAGAGAARGMAVRWVTLLVRLAGMVVTVIYAIAALVIVADIGAFQWLVRDRGWPGAWLGAGVVLTGGVVLILFYFTRLRLRDDARYKRPWQDEADPVGYATIHHEQDELWNRPGIVVRLRRLHLAVAWASIALVTAFIRPWMQGGWQDLDTVAVALAVTALFLPVGLLLGVSLDTGRPRSKGSSRSWRTYVVPWVTWAIRRLSWALALVALLFAAARAGGVDAGDLRAQPALPAIQGAVGVTALALFAVVGAASVVAWLCRARADVPLRAAGNMPSLLLLAAVVGSGMGAGLVLQAARLAGEPGACPGPTPGVICIGPAVDWMAIAFTAILVVFVWVVLLRFGLALSALRKDTPERVMVAVRRITTRGSWLLWVLTLLAMTVLVAGLTLSSWRHGLPPANTLPHWVAWVVTVPLLVPPVVAVIWLIGRARTLGARLLAWAGLVIVAVLVGFAVGHGWSHQLLGVPVPPRDFIALAQDVALLLPTSLVVTRLAYGGLRDRNVRRGVGVLWDIGTFWPRWYHPFAPPTYSDAVVTDLTHRLDQALEPEDSALLLAGHSQGSVIGAVAILGMHNPDRSHGRLAFLTYGSPLNRHYAEFFPAHFTKDCFDVIARRLKTASGAPRWRNLYRKSDPIGGPILPAVDCPAMEDPCRRAHSFYEKECEYHDAVKVLGEMR
jgi:hypothetical protein